MILKSKKLTLSELRLLEKHFESHSFPAPFDVIYEGQVPNTGILLLEGVALLTRSKKVIEQVEAGTVLGIQELISNEPIKYGIKLQENAKVILLQKSEILELLKDENSRIKRALIS